MKPLRCSLSILTALLLLPCRPVSAAELPEPSAKAYVLMDAQTTQIICAANETEKRPMASTTKIMTTLLTLESGDLDTPFTVDSEAIHVEGSSMGLQEGDIVTKRALCTGMLLPSGNDAANAAAVAVGGNIPHFLEMMNARAAEIGMTRSCFASPSGLDAEGHGASAFDMALLAREALKNDEFAEICRQPAMTVSFGRPPFAHTLYNTNKLLTMDNSVIGVKTGYTDAAGRCLVSAAERNGIRLICVTLFDRNDWADHEALYNYAFNCTDKYEVPLPELPQMSVEGGKAQTVSGYIAKPLTVTAWNGKPPELTTSVTTPPFLLAPVEKGDQIGTVIYRSGGREIDRLPVYAAESVAANAPDGHENIIERIKTWVFSR
ncbi:MAG: D-alanyl-D-alanine carboxypeptidase [Oscillospiraceae bacterium]|nr:D-alanyl-D-alanine carboxypeptidase [Oscillospiraceae bacterium]